ncbi:MAG: HEAT repeat domain-containing protein [Rubripirellula sp.]
MKDWIIETRDSGFLTEPEMHRRAINQQKAQHTILQSDSTYPINEILNAADHASRPDGRKLFGGEDPALTYWAIQQRIIRNDQSFDAIQFFHDELTNENAMVRATAAGALARIGRTESAIPIFKELLAAQEPNLRLYVARTMATSFESIIELENEVRLARESLLAPPGSARPWKDFLYSAFTAWALEWSLVKSKLNQWDDFQGL